jgi:transcription-repair coupling factor (superfamily II helicase)
MKLKTPKQIRDNIRKAKITEIIDNTQTCYAQINFENDPIDYHIEFDTNEYSELIEVNKLNILPMDRPLMDDEHNPIDMIQYKVETPIIKVMDEDWALQTCIEKGLDFAITNLYVPHWVKSLETIKAGAEFMARTLISDGYEAELSVGTLVVIDHLIKEVDCV